MVGFSFEGRGGVGSVGSVEQGCTVKPDFSNVLLVSQEMRL